MYKRQALVLPSLQNPDQFLFATSELRLYEYKVCVCVCPLARIRVYGCLTVHTMDHLDVFASGLTVIAPLYSTDAEGIQRQHTHRTHKYVLPSVSPRSIH